MVEALHKSTLRFNKFIGFDFALSNKGWCLIEGNWGQMINQYADKQGRKEEFELFMGYESNH